VIVAFVEVKPLGPVQKADRPGSIASVVTPLLKLEVMSLDGVGKATIVLLDVVAQPPDTLAVTVKVPPTVVVMLGPDWPLDHVYVVFGTLLLAVKVTAVFGQNPAGPAIEITAAWLIVTLIEAVPLQPPPFETVAVYVPGTETVILALLLVNPFGPIQVTWLPPDAVKVVELPLQNCGLPEIVAVILFWDIQIVASANQLQPSPPVPCTQMLVWVLKESVWLWAVLLFHQR
jgi:hypothetical protein